MSNRTKIIIIILALLITIAAYIVLRKPKVTGQNPVSQPLADNSGNGVPRTTSNDSFPLQLGSSGPNVKYLQNALNKIRPLNKLVVDGILGANTRQALLVSVDTKRSALPMSLSNFNSILAQANQS